VTDTFTAEMAKIVVQQERERILEIINKRNAEWQKSHGVNFRAELQKLAQSIKGESE
jgi:uncharacterized protein YihD (DUF1040 family)